jgi:hypothetical protein
MENQSFEALEARFQALQRQVIMLVTVCCIVVVGLLSIWIFTTIRNLGVVRTRAIEIVDENGNCIMGLQDRNYYGTVDRNTYPYWAMQTPVLWMKDRNGRLRVTVGIANDGEPVMTFRNELGRSTVVLRSLSSGVQGLTIFDSSGELLFSAP